MKKLLLVFVLAFSTVAYLQAQDFKMGVRAGYNYADFYGDNEGTNYDGRGGAHAGLLFNYTVTEDFFSIQPEVLWSLKGARDKNANPEKQLRIHTIDVPVLAKINAGKLYFEAGPMGSVMFSAHQDPGDVDVGNQLNRFLIGGLAGIGAEFPNGIGIGARVSGDLTQTYENGTGPLKDLRNYVLMATASYMIQKK